MAYHPLSNVGTPEERREEADRLIELIAENQGELNEKERDFVADIEMGGNVSAKQLFWLRDIKDKYL